MECVLIKKKCIEKQRTINHMIIFNDSIGKFTSAAIEVFAKTYLCLLLFASTKKCQELNSSVRNLKKYVSKIKYTFV